MNFATFILSTGRCGTQWIAAALTEGYSDGIDVEHEPLHGQYEPRKLLACRDTRPLPSALSPVVLSHMDAIERRLETRAYLECGHPNWSAIPHLVERFRGRVRIVHLTRHPVSTSCSWLTHGAYQPPLLPHLTEKTLLSPFDDGISFTDYRDNWKELRPFEKCLFYWSEVHSFALDVQSRLNVPWLRLKYEDLFDHGGLEQLLTFLELPQRANVFGLRSKTVDKFRYVTEHWGDWRQIENHPRVKAIAQQLGYDLNEIDEDLLQRRYRMGR